MSSEKSFTDLMRDKTKSIHTSSDHLVNLKLGVALAEDKVWAEGILVFYEIFRFLENSLELHRDSLMGELIIPGLMNRTDAMEKDLSFYLGPSWKEKDNYVIRPEVAKYLQHLQEIEKREPYLLMAYVYHLYMGLLSGGQILNGKRKLLGRRRSHNSSSNDGQSGENLTFFGPPNVTLYSLKKQLREATNRISLEFDDELKEAILEEGVKVFENNNRIISTVKGVNEIFLRKLLCFIVVVFLILSLLYWLLF